MDSNITIGDIFSTALIMIGMVFMVLGAVGVVRMPDVLIRSQATSKTATLGIGSIYIAAAIHFSESPGMLLRALAVILFTFLTVPIGVHAITRAAHNAGVPLWPEDLVDQLREQQARENQSPEPGRTSSPESVESLDEGEHGPQSPPT